MGRGFIAPAFAAFTLLAGALLLLPNGAHASNGLTVIPPQVAYTPGRKSMTNPINVYIIWYGANWTPNSKAIITDFIAGFDKSDVWKVATKYYNTDKTGTSPKTFVSSTLKLNGQSDDRSYSLGKFLNFHTSKNYDDLLTLIQAHIQGGRLPTDQNGIYLVLTDDQTLEAGFMRNYCSKVGSTAAVKLAAKQAKDNRISSRAPDVRWVFAGSTKATSKDGPLGCTSYNTDVSPNGNPDVDIIVDSIANGILNFAVNPWVDPSLDAWSDKEDGWNDGFPPAANCAFNYGNTAVDGQGALYNEQWNGRKYLIQRMWDPEAQLCHPRSANVPSDCTALQQILSNQTYLGDDCCNSGYASCANGHIVGLDLTNFGLTDTPEVVIDTLQSAFPDLRVLDLSKNSMAAGPVPTSICQFQKLEFLWMRNFTTAPTSLPDCFGSMTNLKLFSVVSNSRLSGPVPQSLTKLSNLREVLLDGCDFTGTFPDFSKSPKLTAVSASGNSKLSGKLVSGYKALDKPLLNKDGTYDGSCDLSGTKVCSAGGPDCKVKKC